MNRTKLLTRTPRKMLERSSCPIVRLTLELFMLLAASGAALLGGLGLRGADGAWPLGLLYAAVAAALLWLRRSVSRHPHAFLGVPTGAAGVTLATGTLLGSEDPAALAIRLWVFTVVYLGGANVLLDVMASQVGMPPAQPRRVSPDGWQFTVKYAIDRIVAAVALVALAPILALVALAVRVESPGGVIFRQRRVGQGGAEFDLLKFRSMRLSEVTPAFVPPPGLGPGGIEGSDRRTRVGRILRTTCLDELPQLINVLRGEMSLIGPRPERPEFVARFKREVPGYGDRHRVKVGITGWSQAHGLRGQTSISERAALDNQYIDGWSVRLELRVLALTVLEVLGVGRGPNQITAVVAAADLAPADDVAAAAAAPGAARVSAGEPLAV